MGLTVNTLALSVVVGDDGLGNTLAQSVVVGDDGLGNTLAQSNL